ncbi:hypothetical protein K432DRAFT_150531 [Lepidopterella palustris CBS 459.81]|uniref:Uncharacterized protein n=1 Tax=Lepidopterella palustris CBS 459.81 TaxID=1314670 RepID=A0A8E2E2Y3_9PEZI|nr:hypothetical protein K432DRAFT_150531 [Lepidopterella palustris CBS 459.81]
MTINSVLRISLLFLLNPFPLLLSYRNPSQKRQKSKSQLKPQQESIKTLDQASTHMQHLTIGFNRTHGV